MVKRATKIVERVVFFLKKHLRCYFSRTLNICIAIKKWPSGYHFSPPVKRLKEEPIHLLKKSHGSNRKSFCQTFDGIFKAWRYRTVNSIVVQELQLLQFEKNHWRVKANEGTLAINSHGRGWFCYGNCQLLMGCHYFETSQMDRCCEGRSYIGLILPNLPGVDDFQSFCDEQVMFSGIISSSIPFEDALTTNLENPWDSLLVTKKGGFRFFRSEAPKTFRNTSNF